MKWLMGSRRAHIVSLDILEELTTDRTFSTLALWDLVFDMDILLREVSVTMFLLPR